MMPLVKKLSFRRQYAEVGEECFKLKYYDRIEHEIIIGNFNIRFFDVLYLLRVTA